MKKEEKVYVGIEEGFDKWDVSTKIMSTSKTDFKKLVEAPIYDVWSRGLSANSCKMKTYFAWPEAVEE